MLPGLRRPASDNIFSTGVDKMDLSKAVEISDSIHWVGTGSKSILSRNSYLRVFSAGGKNINLLIDPGPPVDLDIIATKITDVIENVARINMIFVNHQDPDVVGNLPYFSRMNPNCHILATEDTWRLVNLLGLNSKFFRPVERFSTTRASLPSGHLLQFVATPFCHFRGACMLYDLESRILFTGDLFGGIAAQGLFATEENWTGIKAFHQLYMPSNDALKLAVDRIRQLDPAPLMIAPQHGGIIKGDLIETFLSKLESLKVGLDIIVALKDQLPILLAAVNEIVDLMREVVGEEKIDSIMKAFHPDGSYPSLFILSRNNKVLEIKGEPFETMETMVKIFFREMDERQKSVVSIKLLRILLDHNLPPFDTLLAAEMGDQGALEFIEE
jgi:flavorubredoxin